MLGFRPAYRRNSTADRKETAKGRARPQGEDIRARADEAAEREAAAGHSSHLAVPKAAVSVSGTARIFEAKADSGHTAGRGFALELAFSPCRRRGFFGLPGRM